MTACAIPSTGHIFTMVALDENDKPKPVPRLMIETEAEKAEREAAKKRREMRMKRKEEGF